MAKSVDRGRSLEKTTVGECSARLPSPKRSPKSERAYKNDIIKRMRNLGTYRDEFLPTIDRLARLYVHRENLEREFDESGGAPTIEYTNKAGATNIVKNPILAARDEVYDQLLSHERELGLTPQALKKMNETAMKGRPTSSFAAAIASALDGAGA